MRTLLIHALRSEAGIIRQHFPGAERPACGPGIELRQLSTEFDLLRTGMGLTACEQVLSKLSQPGDYERIIHFGVSGSMSEDLEVQDLIQGVEFLAAGRDILKPPAFVHPWGLDIPQVTFFSADAPVQTEDQRQEIKQFPVHAVDMESYAVAAFANQHHLPLLALRCISDRAGESTAADFKRHYTRAAQKLQSFLLDHLLRM